MAAFEADFAALDPHVFHFGADIEDRAVARDEGGFFADFDGA